VTGRLGVEVVTIGDYHLVGASAGAWLGIGIVSVVSTLGPTQVRRPR
jgi:hypothetical protein